MTKKLTRKQRAMTRKEMCARWPTNVSLWTKSMMERWRRARP